MTAETEGSLRKLKILAVVIIIVMVAADLGTKAWMADLLGMAPAPGVHGPFGRIEIIPGFLALEGIYNPGVTFGLAKGQTNLILLFTVVATLLLFVWLLATRQPSRMLHIGLGLVIAGALGNLWDRWHWAMVRDFILFYVGDWKWPNFNVADSCIVVGVIMILFDEIFLRGKRERARAAA